MLRAKYHHDIKYFNALRVCTNLDVIVAGAPATLSFIWCLSVCLYVVCPRRTKQDAQLSQRDRAAGCVIVFAKSRTLELGDNILRTL